MSRRRIGIAVAVAVCLGYLFIWPAFFWRETGTSMRFPLPTMTGDVIKIEATGPYARHTEGIQPHQLRSLPADAIAREYIVATGLDDRNVYMSKVETVPAGIQYWEPAGGGGDMILVGQEGTTIKVSVATPVQGIIASVVVAFLIASILFWKRQPRK